MTSLLQSLAGSEGFPRVSLYLPTHPTYPECQQDPIRLSNGLKEVERQLTDAGWRESDVVELTAEAAACDKDDLFWRYQDDGLAVFIEPGATRWVKLPQQVPELAILAHRYHVRPLIPILRDKGRFHVLAVTEDKARFFNGTEEGLREIAVADMPESTEEIWQRTGFDADIGFHSRDRGQQVGGPGAPKFAALGESPQDYETVVLDQYTRGIAKAVDAHLANSEAPLVLVALPRMLGYLAQHLEYRHVAADHVAADPAPLSNAELHEKTWAVAEPILTHEREELRKRLRAAIEGALPDYTRNLEGILRAAGEGRVDTVFVSPGETVWGVFDPSYRVIRIDRVASPENEDLLNLAALRTLAQGGDVRTLPDDVRETLGPVAALYRY
ncbi:MAG: hypothetical protein ACLFPA_00540 [Dichotomicrobium sp.]